MLDTLTRKIQDALRIIGGKASINEKNITDAVDAIKLALLEADVNLRVVRRFINATAEEAHGERVLRAVNPSQMFVKIVHDKLVAFLGDSTQDLALRGPDTLSVVLMLGLQGSGKTTSSAKLAAYLKKHGRKPFLAACDLVRPAAAEQLAVLGREIDVPVYREDGATDSVAVYKTASHNAEKAGADTLIVDTTGRLQIDETMMAELSRLKSAANPVESLLVADSMTGQSAADIARVFNDKIGLSGVILTKFDSDTRGGAALSVKTITGKPIKFMGTGEKLTDLEVFHPERVASRILGMGDVVSLVEKAQEVVDEEQARIIQEKMRRNEFTLQDYLDQIRAIKKMGAISSVLDMIPGLSGQINPEDIDKSEVFKHEVIISSMTKKERANYLIIGPSRRARIARGSGTSVAEVSRLLKRFERIRTMMRKMAKISKNGNPNPKELAKLARRKRG